MIGAEIVNKTGKQGQFFINKRKESKVVAKSKGIVVYMKYKE